eukprot:gene5480-biopygen4224
MQIGAEGTGLILDAHLLWQHEVFRVEWRRAAAGGGGGRQQQRVVAATAAADFAAGSTKTCEIVTSHEKIVSLAPQAPEKMQIPITHDGMIKQRRRRRRGIMICDTFLEVRMEFLTLGEVNVGGG